MLKRSEQYKEDYFKILNEVIKNERYKKSNNQYSLETKMEKS